MVELLVVLVIVAILMAAALPSLNKTRENSGAPKVNAAAGTVWRAINMYRIDNHGVMPPVSMLQNPTTFADAGGGRYVRRWPEGSDGAPIVVQAGGAGTVPTAANFCTTRRGALIYGVANGAAPHTGWLIGCAPSGKIVYRRSILQNIPAAGVPAG